MKSMRYSVVLITHKMKDVFRCADRITVLRAGRLVETLLREQATEEHLIALMFEKELTTRIVRTSDSVQLPSQPVLELRNVNTHGEGAVTSLTEIGLAVFPGEIVGVAGVSGNGQKELGDVVLGMERITKGQKMLFGEDYTRRSISDIRKDGVSFIPENPLSMATVPFMTVLENMALTNTWRYTRFGGLRFNWPAVLKDMKVALDKFGFSFSPYSMAQSLSGGNLQRFIIAREMAYQPKLMVASYITSGLDVHSTAVARQALLQARNEGAGVLLISEDLEELFLLSDRLIVIYAGRIVGQFKPTETNSYTVGLLMTGSEA